MSVSAPPVRHRGIKVAYVFAGSTGAWMAHLFFGTSFVRYTCNAQGTVWYQHLATALCALVAAHATWVAYGLHREGRIDPEDAGSSFGANNFVGVVGIIVGLANLLLILAEGSMVGLIHGACR